MTFEIWWTLNKPEIETHTAKSWAREAWDAACEMKQVEIDELKKRIKELEPLPRKKINMPFDEWHEKDVEMTTLECYWAKKGWDARQAEIDCWKKALLDSIEDEHGKQEEGFECNLFKQYESKWIKMKL